MKWNRTPTPNGANAPSECLLAAKHARLRYAADGAPGIRRVRSGKGFRYFALHGRPITDPRVLERVRKLAVPPAWSSVWICPNSNGHLQATGRDAKGRKQYRYHARWRAVRDENKFDRLISFAEALPRIRRRVRRDLKLVGVARDKVLATIVRLLETTLIRIGNEEYAQQNGSFGITTMRNRHARVAKDEIDFEFRGKGGIRHRITVYDRRLAQIVKRCQEIPGQKLFQYLDEGGRRHTIGSAEVNAYLRAAGGGEFTAKDFRTWSATILAARVLQGSVGASKKKTKRGLARCIDEVARKLGNTATVCRKCYIHPALVEAYLDGSLEKSLHRQTQTMSQRPTCTLTPEEATLLAWLRKRHGALKR